MPRPHRILLLILLLALPAGALSAQEPTLPPGWKTRPDAPARLVAEQRVPEGAYRFVTMAPGWHITSGPGLIMYQAEHALAGPAVERPFTVESEMFLFPDASAEEYGLFIAGKALESDGVEYLAFLLRRDGSAGVFHRAGDELHEIHPWTPAESVARIPASGGTAKNVIRVEVTATTVRYMVNGGVIAELPRAHAAVAGSLGFRAGPGVNLHVSTLDVTFRLAPPRPQN